MKRREFVQKSTAGLTALTMCELLKQHEALGFPTSGGMGIQEAVSKIADGKDRNTMPMVRPEILNNPRAVFIMETHVNAQHDENGCFDSAIDQLRAEGKRCAQQFFVKGTERGGSTFIKGNFTMKMPGAYHRTSGVYTQPDFIVGVVDHLRDIGNTNLLTGETATPAINRRLGKLYEAFDPASIPVVEPGYAAFEDYEKDELNWFDTPNSKITKKTALFRPIGDKDTFLINMGTLKCHLTGLTTIGIKNLQGTVAKGYGQFCTSWMSFEGETARDGGIGDDNIRGDWMEDIEASFVKHRAAGYKRWDPDGYYARYEAKGGWDAYRKARGDSQQAMRAFMGDIRGLMSHEMWLNRAMDNLTVVKPQLNLIEGIIGLDGEELHRDGIGTNQLVNVVFGGVSPYEVDVIGNYIMGHDPREIWYTRYANELGRAECDPSKIDIYKIQDNGEIVKIDLSQVKRHPLGLNWARREDPDQRLFW